MNEYFIKGFEKTSSELTSKTAPKSQHKKNLMLGAGAGAGFGVGTSLLEHLSNIDRAKRHNKSVRFWSRIVRRNPSLPKSLVDKRLPVPKLNKKLLATTALAGGILGTGMGALVNYMDKKLYG